MPYGHIAVYRSNVICLEMKKSFLVGKSAKTRASEEQHKDSTRTSQMSQNGTEGGSTADLIAIILTTPAFDLLAILGKLVVKRSPKPAPEFASFSTKSCHIWRGSS